MLQRTKKRLLIIFIYFLSALIFLSVLVLFLLPDPSCFDGERNQGEERVDCGGPCAPCSRIVKLDPITVKKTEWVSDGKGAFDAVILLKNPNKIYGAAKFSLVIREKEGKIFEENKKETFLLPSEEKTILMHGLVFEGEPKNIEVIIDQDKIDWKRFVDYEKPDLIVNNSQYKTVFGEPGVFGRAIGSVVNQSSIDFEAIVVKVVLRSKEGKLLATNSQVMNTVRAGERRDYSIIFPQEFPGEVEKVMVETETNVFDSNNYIQTHGVPEKWEAGEL